MSREPIKPNPQTNRMLGSSPAGTPKNYRVVSADNMNQKRVRPEVRQRLKNMLNTPTPGGDVDPKTGDLIPESVKKAGHPEAFELGLEGETISNPEYQKILRRKRIERAIQMTDPNHPHHDTDDVSQDDVVAADRAARGRKFNPKNVGKDAY